MLWVVQDTLLGTVPGKEKFGSETTRVQEDPFAVIGAGARATLGGMASGYMNGTLVGAGKAAAAGAAGTNNSSCMCH